METKIIDEQLEDKQQIVTYKYLTQKLNIHPNKAKELLKDYVSKLTNDKKYSVTIIMGGTSKDNDEFCIVLAHDDHVETMRRRFKQIDFEHLYSIQPINRLSDINNTLHLVDNSTYDNVNLPSSIKKKEKVNSSLQYQNVENIMEIDSPSIKENNLTQNTILNNISEIILETKSDDKTQKKKTEFDLFAKNNKSSNSKPAETEKTVIPKKTNSDFFSKFKKSSNSDNIKANSKSEVSVENVINDNTKMDVELSKISVQEHSPCEYEEKIKQKSDNNREKHATTKSNKKIEIGSPKTNVQEYSINKLDNKNKKTSIKKKTNKNKNNQKIKRKRIQTFDDSSSEELDSEEEDKKKSENMDVENEVDFVQSTPPRPTPRENRRKEKQTTTSTFIDDDGFVCTTKEVKFVEMDCEPSESVDNVESSKLDEAVNKINKSCDSSSAVPVDKKKSKNKQSKNSSSQGMKQSSLTSFFKSK